MSEDVPKSKLMAGPAMFGLRRITGWEKLARFARFGWGLSRWRIWRFSPYDCSGRGPVWGRGRFVVGQI